MLGCIFDYEIPFTLGGFVMNKSYSLMLIGCACIFIHNAKAEDNQLALHAPIQLTPSGISLFLRTTFNRPEYVSDILPYSLSHFIQLIQHGKTIQQQKRAYIKSVIKLFGNKIKNTTSLNA